MRIDVQNAILLLLCLVLLLSVFSLSASAADERVLVLPYSTGNEPSIYIGYRNGYSRYYLNTSSSADVYSFVYKRNGTDAYSVAFVSETYGASGNLHYYNSSDVYQTTNTYSIESLNSDTGLYETTISLTITSLGVSYFASFSEGINAVRDYIDNPPSPSPSPSPLQYSLPPGNVIYIQVPQGASYTLKTRMPESVLGSNHYPGNNQAITLVQSLPSGGTAPTSPLIPWLQDGALSVLGLSRNAIYEGTNASAGYLCIVNPLYYSGTANGPYEFLSNGSIDISVDTQTGFVVYPLDSSLGFTSGLGINVDTTILDNPYTGEIDPDTGEITWEDSNGGSTAPTTGGGNLVSTSETIFDFLRNIADEISTFLKGPIQAIQTVVAAIRQFLSTFTQLYMWLPAPVYNLITSALMIALTIGVIKIFV